ncbi:hypothetical protein [Gemmiger sp. An120]|uniref:hypothetical protein n=1 Tax=Gemmiger sp. An120 TaxID=1965549 RepID=UPI001FA8D8CA|nr:hypothetical protein [Gemmiger sp. An120]
MLTTAKPRRKSASAGSNLCELLSPKNQPPKMSMMWEREERHRLEDRCQAYFAHHPEHKGYSDIFDE